MRTWGWIGVMGWALGACQVDALDAQDKLVVGQADSVEETSQALPVEAAPAALDMTLTVAPTLPADVEATFTIEGAPPGGLVRFLFSFIGDSGGICPRAWGGICLEIESPYSSLGRVTADANGTAVLTRVPPESLVGATTYIQAVVLDGTDTHTSNVQVMVIEEPPPDNDGDGYAVIQGDCNDNNPNINPGMTEICNGIDDDCQNGIDRTDAWWDTNYPYRIPLTITNSPNWETFSAPAAVDINFGAALNALGDSTALNPDSIRVVYQDCSAGQPELPTEFVDDMARVFASNTVMDNVGNERGAVAFLVDTDGDYSTSDRFINGQSRQYAVYFGSDGTMPNAQPQVYNTSLVASSNGVTSELSNDRTEALFERSSGGLATRIGPAGFNSVGSQDSTPFGNGMYINGWLSARDDTTATLQLIHSGPILGVVRSSGSVSNSDGGFSYTYTYFMFEGRPELYARVQFRLNQQTTIGPQNPFFGSGVRPFMVDNNSLAVSAPSEGAGSIPDYDWVRGAYATGGASPYGIAVGYRESVGLRSRPIFTPSGSSDSGRYVGLAGQDVVSPWAAQSTYNGVFGEVIVDNTVLSIYPHTGLFGSVSLDFFGSLDGVTTSVGAAEAR